MQGLGELCFDIPGLRRLFETPESRNWVRLSRGVLRRTHSGGGLGTPLEGRGWILLGKGHGTCLVPGAPDEEARG